MHQHFSGVAMIFGPPCKQLVWAPGRGFKATTSSWRAPGGPLPPRGPPAVAGPAGPSLRHCNIFNRDFISQKKLQRLRTASLRSLPNFILPSHPIITVDLSMNVNNWAHPLNHVICFKYLLQICTKMNGFKFDFSKHLWGGAPSPFPTPFPLRLGFALSSGFVLYSWALRTLYSGFALDYRALRSLDSGFTLIFQLVNWFDPKIYSWIRQCWSAPPLVNSLFGYW